MAMDRVENGLGNLCAGTIIEKNEPWLLVERRKKRADSIAGKIDGPWGI